MIITLDTNVLYQALYSDLGASFFILEKIRKRKIKLALSLPVFYEYEEVLKRKESLKSFNLNIEDIDKVLRLLAYVGKVYEPYFLLRSNLRDESDNIFIELAITSQSEFLITNNIKHFMNSELKYDNLKIVTPGDFVKYWREKNE